MFSHTTLVLQTTLRSMGLTIAAVVIASCAACGGGGGGGGGGEASAAGTATFASTNLPINLTLNATRVTGVAPLGVSFDIDGTSGTRTSKPFHEMRFKWSFGDAAGGATWGYGPFAGVASKNLAEGPVAAHVFETPGTYTVAVTAFDGVNTATKNVTVTVTDPNAVFNTNTVYVSQSALPVPGADGVPLGATVRYMPNWSSLKTLVRDQGFRRIFLKRGDVWNVDGWADFNNATTFAGPGLIAAYGTGANPKIISDIDAPIFRFVNVSDWRVMDVVAMSNDPAGVAAGNRHCFAYSGGRDLTLLRVKVQGCLINIFTGIAEGMFLVDSQILNSSRNTPAGSIAMYADSTKRHAILGNLFTGSGGHGIRLQGTANSVVSHNQVDTPQFHSHVLTVRGFANVPTNVWTGIWTDNVVVSNNLLDGTMGSIDPLAIKPQSNNQHAERLRNVLVEGNHIKAGGASAAVILEVANDVTFRNNICVTENAAATLIVQGNNPLSPAPTSTYIYNNTFYKKSSAVSTSYVGVLITDPLPTGTVMKNNLAYAPGALFNGFGASPPIFFHSTQAGGGSHIATNNSTITQIQSTSPWSAATPNGYADYTPVAYGTSGGLSVPVWSDFMGVLVNSTRVMGAVQPQ